MMINHEIKVNTSYITLDNPRNYNAFSDVLIKDFVKIIEDIEKNEKIRFVILKSSGQNFSSGADLKWMESMAESSKVVNEKDALLLATLLDRLNILSKPVIALVQGKTFGGALGLLACCDIVIAETNAHFCFSEVKLGLIPATIAPYIVQCIGSSATRFYFLSAKPFDAHKAEQLGLVHFLCDEGSLEEAGETILQRLAKNGPKALSETKALIHQIEPVDPTLTKKTAQLLAEIRVSKEGQEGLKAFLEKRNPSWMK